MTTDEAKQWLNRYRDASMAVKRLESQLAEVRANMDGVRAIQYSDMPKSPSVSGDLSDAVARLSDLELQLSREKTRAAETLCKTIAVINSLQEQVHRTLLDDRYVHLMPWWQIAKKHDYSERRMYQLHDEAIDEIIKRLQ